jgi:hypothetical protein
VIRDFAYRTFGESFTDETQVSTKLTWAAFLAFGGGKYVLEFQYATKGRVLGSN